MGMEGAENISKYLDNMTSENIDITEALSAKEYFTLHSGYIMIANLMLLISRMIL